jgi:hypothetical protein
MAILILTAALGVAGVIGTYWYATTMDLAADHRKLAPVVTPVSPQPDSNDRAQ